MSALSAVLSTRVERCMKFGEVSCTVCTGHGNDCELISTVKMELDIQGSFGSGFPAICNHCGVTAAGSLKTPKRAVKRIKYSAEA